MAAAALSRSQNGNRRTNAPAGKIVHKIQIVEGCRRAHGLVIRTRGSAAMKGSRGLRPCPSLNLLVDMLRATARQPRKRGLSAASFFRNINPVNRTS